MELWKGTRIISAEYDAASATAALSLETEQGAWILFGIERPRKKIVFNGNTVAQQSEGNNQLQLFPEGNGILSVSF